MQHRPKITPVAAGAKIGKELKIYAPKTRNGLKGAEYNPVLYNFIEYYIHAVIFSIEYYIPVLRYCQVLFFLSHE